MCGTGCGIGGSLHPNLGEVIPSREDSLTALVPLPFVILEEHPSWSFAADPSTDGSRIWITHGVDAVGTSIAAGMIPLQHRRMILASNDHDVRIKHQLEVVFPACCTVDKG
jgi:hypothetical protein